MEKQPSEEKLSFEEKISLYFLAGAGLLVWVIATLFILTRYYSPARALAAAPPVAYPMLTTAYTSRPTFTATRPPAPTSTATPTPTPMPTPTPTETPLPSSVPLVPIGSDTQVIALLGIDEKQASAVWRTDSIILAFFDPKAKRLSLLSVPRDLWVRIPGYASNRINTVDALGERTKYPGGGPALLDKTLRLNLGVPVHHYVRVDFRGFVRIIDAMGGVTVDVKKPITDDFPDPLDASGWAWITLPAGSRHMDGRMALRYCRSRVTTDDFDRNARQQQVLFALWKKALTIETLTRAPQLWVEFKGAFNTDLGMTEAIQLASVVQGLDPGQVRSKHMDYKLARAWTTSQGAQVLLPQTEAIQQAIIDLLEPE